MSVRFGACVASARLHARLGSPMPTKTTSWSRSSAAATHTIRSAFSAPAFGRVGCLFSASGSIAIVHAGAQSLLGGESIREPGNLRQIFTPIADAEDEVVEVLIEPRRVRRDVFPGDIELVVAVVVALRVRRMRAPRLEHDGVDDEA